MNYITKLTPKILQRIIEEERQKLIKEGAITRHKPGKKRRKKKIISSKKKNINHLKELALIERKQKLAVKAFKILFERKKELLKNK